MVLVAVVLGCSGGPGLDLISPDFPRYDQVLTYDHPYDYTFLKTMEALNTFPNWILEETDKGQGLIVLRNTEYGHVFDRDKNVARFRVTRVSRTQTSVEIEPESQQVLQVGDLLRRVDQVMSRSLRGHTDKLAAEPVR